MTAKLSYLDDLKDYLRIDPATESDVVRELDAHLEDKSQELKESGFSEEEATETAVQFLGSPRLIARQMYEVYSQGSWRQALFAALPHFLIASLFALHWWHSTTWLLALLAAVIGAVIYGWCHGKPAWLFPWLGYCLIPVLAVGTLLIYLPGNWAWLAAIAYVPLALLALVSVTKQTIKRDWLFASLMLLPIPIVLSWILALGIKDGLLQYEHIHHTSPWIALSFAVLAVTAATFVRIRQRWAKAGALVTPQILLLLAVALTGKYAVSFWAWLLLVILSLFLLVGPALLERKIR
jgi:hypothetical protein